MSVDPGVAINVHGMGLGAASTLGGYVIGYTFKDKDEISPSQLAFIVAIPVTAILLGTLLIQTNAKKKKK